ncbi:PREDICTED: F-box/FBD/LRR-repeat protein At1g13570-like isoform X2 [Ipomoea nil]|uniref:F-box/FBD/LRR-repeat protein At1g13570-like isoform X2 n=1 Tax=Ipomoea nil TaxID=35883 RepID=UPI0009011F47|nr:PREDICTED: F-box/FBD/LRR-repeat protein At1g13570-like isoform X2 [Ipomoea nil]
MHIVERSTSIPVNRVENIYMAVAGEDRISELPVGILDNILGFLPIQEAARTVILSSSWKDIWFSLTKLNLGYGFFDYLCLKYSGAEGLNSESPIFDVINKILMRHNGPIHKIVFEFSGEVLEFISSEEFDFEDIANLISDNLNRWFLLLTQNGVEEIGISYYMDIEVRCRVPNCIFSCPTRKRLKLDNVSVELINAYCVLPNVTSLFLQYVDFKPSTCSDYVVYLPILEGLTFVKCYKIFYFNIVAPKLGSLEIILPCCDYCKEFGVLPPNLDLRSISSLNLECSTCCFKVFIEELNRVGQPFALNVERLKLCISSDNICLPDIINSSAFIHLLRVCPKLCELDICDQLDIYDVEFLRLNRKDFVLMEELSSVARTLKMLHTLKFSYFHGLGSEMQCIKVLLSCFPVIEKVVIVRGWIHSDEEFKITQELLRFPRASEKVEIFYILEY